MAAAGSANLPVSGNAENINRLMHFTRYTTIGVQLRDNIGMEAVGVCGNSDSALHLEETLRAYRSMGMAATARQPAVVGLLNQMTIRREDRSVHVGLSVSGSQFGELLRLF